jgi:hypothetical protein
VSDKQEEPRQCCACDERNVDELEWAADPYAHEIMNDETPVWMCKRCRAEACRDI